MGFFDQLFNTLLKKENDIQGNSLTTEETNKPLKYGTYGRLEIKELNISIPLYEATSKNSQQIVDAEDSAAILHWGTQDIIADHVTSANFSNLIKSRPGKTKGYIGFADGTKKEYVCMASQIGHIKIGKNGQNNHMYDWRWTPLTGKNPGGLTIYTCLGFSHDGIQDTTITYWLPSEEAYKVQSV